MVSNIKLSNLLCGGGGTKIIFCPAGFCANTHAPVSCVWPSFTFSKIFSPETAGPIKAKLHLEHPSEGGTKVCIIGPGHVTKMVAMAINSKNL